MRPRPMTAENPASPRSKRWTVRCFNEAAADDRGKPQAIRHYLRAMPELQ